LSRRVLRVTCAGDMRSVDGYVADGAITFQDYPNAFERIAGVLDLDVAGHLWATSKPGYEFGLKSTKIHAGDRSHGSLHVLDSVSPLWVAGAPVEITMPEQARAIDVATIWNCVGTSGPGLLPLARSSPGALRTPGRIPLAAPQNNPHNPPTGRA